MMKPITSNYLYVTLVITGAATTLMASPVVNAAQPYFSASIGRSDIELDQVSDTDIKDNDTFASIGFGFDITNNLAAELTYNDYGEASANIGDNKASFEASSFSAAIVFKYPLGASFNLGAKAGLDIWETEGESYQDEGTDIFFAVGGSFDISEETELGAYYELHSFELSDIEASGPIDTDYDIDVFSIGVKFKF